ncbi:hyaluronidase domain-containing protein [Ditylenchus destructor]|nr:hyaluronidase domain-containing protein [Ditylenchus destructor]
MVWAWRGSPYRRSLTRRDLLFTCALIFHYFLGSSSGNSRFPKRRFEVYWNVPSASCTKNYTLDPSVYGIRTNDKQQFHGSEIVTFYEDQLGYYPRCEAEKITDQNSTRPKYRVKKCVNGGLPQNANLTEHLKKAREDIEKLIPNIAFSGPAVIDWESWRPAYSLNWADRTIYRSLSTRDAKRRFPDLSDREAHKVGRELFNSAARQFIRETILLARKLRPYAQWGFYDFPLCNYDSGESGEWECRKKFENYNTELLWMYEYVKAFYPPIYLYDISQDPAIARRYVHAKILETRWVQFKLGKTKTPIYAYSKIEYDPYQLDTPFYTDAAICSTLEYPANYGLKGVIIWSSSWNMTQRCGQIADYVSATLGPVTKQTHNRVARCAAKMCNNHGRCQLKNPQNESTGCAHDYYPEDYTCKCDAGYTGEYCENVEEGKSHRNSRRPMPHRYFVHRIRKHNILPAGS